MAVRIRLRRTGKKKQPQYRLVVADARRPRDGRFLEVVGHYNPCLAEPAVKIDEERALYWLNQGALPTDTVKALLRKRSVWERFLAQKSGAGPEAEVPSQPEASAEAPGEV